ncbi:Hypothetical predicted protein [Lecanosticta acicola]|uniref:Uncharacterized protein n=1 Tax=Lecanosticta acicola TaxID=111012 RepID=A0AAI9EFR4_9PEZI|nr:Hypothetical predicted protein [Lecanosticta acicola]
MSRQRIAAHYSRLLARWPKDQLRPEKQFSSILQQRTQKPPVPYRDEEKEVNSAYLLLDNAITKQFPLQEKLLRPASNPEHYEALKRELEELPNRSWLQNFTNRMKRMVRFT